MPVAISVFTDAISSTVFIGAIASTNFSFPLPFFFFFFLSTSGSSSSLLELDELLSESVSMGWEFSHRTTDWIAFSHVKSASSIKLKSKTSIRLLFFFPLLSRMPVTNRRMPSLTLALFGTDAPATSILSGMSENLF